MLSLRSAMESTLLEPPLFVSERRDAFLLASWALAAFSASSELSHGANVFGPDWEVVKPLGVASGAGSRMNHSKPTHYIPRAPSSQLPEAFRSALRESFIMQDSAFVPAAACGESPSRRLETLGDLLDACEEVSSVALHVSASCAHVSGVCVLQFLHRRMTVDFSESCASAASCDVIDLVDDSDSDDDSDSRDGNAATRDAVIDDDPVCISAGAVARGTLNSVGHDDVVHLGHKQGPGAAGPPAQRGGRTSAELEFDRYFAMTTGLPVKFMEDAAYHLAASVSEPAASSDAAVGAKRSRDPSSGGAREPIVLDDSDEM